MRTKGLVASVVMVAIVVMCGFLFTAEGAWKTGWKNSTGDLCGKSNLNVAVDAIWDAVVLDKAALTTETNRAITAEALLATKAALTTETNRAITAEALLATKAALTTETNRAITAEALLAAIADVWGTPGVTPSVDGPTNTVSLQAKDIGGTALVGYRVFHLWMSETSLGTASTNNIESMTLSGGSAVATVTANSDYWYATGANGTATNIVIGTAAGTNYLMVTDGSAITATAIVFE